MVRLHTLRIGLAPTRRIALAVATLVVMILGAAWIAYHSHAKSRDLTSLAQQDRQEALVAERAISEFWKERESIGEYLAVPSADLAAEITTRRRAFEALTGREPKGFADDESRREASFLARSTKANADLVADATALKIDRADSAAQRRVLERLHEAEQTVLHPLHAAYELNRRQYRQREAMAESASTTALRIELASALLGLAAIGWFAFFASGLVRRVDRQNTALREADELKDEFINTVSHELRTPITSIQGYLELLLDTGDGADPLTDEQRRFLVTVTRSSERLLHLVNDLLLVAQAQAGRLEMSKEPSDLVAIARQSVEAAHATAAKNDIALSLRGAKAAVLNVDPARLGQAIDNLISNAIKFTPGGGSITVDVSPDNGHTLITITDTGMGMTGAEVGRLFERFFRTRSATEQRIQGTGLGLTITKSIVDAHGGTIGVTSEPGAGTTFTISLATSDDVPGAPQRLRAAHPGASAERRGYSSPIDHTAIRPVLPHVAAPLPTTAWGAVSSSALRQRRYSKCPYAFELPLNRKLLSRRRS
jgi:signal transduction histidine kinase